MFGHPRVGLRARATLAFGLTGLVVAFGLAGITFAVARGYLIAQRESAATQQAYVNARLARTVLRNPNADVPAFLSGLGGGSVSNSALRYRGEWFSTSVAFGSTSLPNGLITVVANGRAGHQRFKAAGGELDLVVGVPIAAIDASYFEVFPLGELDRTLGLLARALMVGAGASVLVAAAVGRTAANRLVRPLAPVADAAERIADGALDTRLDEAADPDLRKLSHAFNAMAAALEARIEREARFAADVSHELRSPLTAVAAAVEIIERRRDQLPPQVTEAFTVLAKKIRLFQQMVLDLLEISRLDAGSAPLIPEQLDTSLFLRALATGHGVDPARVSIDADVPPRFLADRLRLGQALGNVMDNARNYAGGVTQISVSRGPEGALLFMLDDAGPGIPAAERVAIFGRFARGSAGYEAGSSSGTGLGLALVTEHIRLHRGTVTLEDSPEGGARFVIEIPGATDV